MRGRGARDCSTGRGRTCERRGAGGEGTRATRPVPGGAVWVEGRRRRRAETARRRRGCGTSGRRRACSGVAGAGGRGGGRGRAAAAPRRRPTPAEQRQEQEGQGQRGRRAERSPADVRCVARQKGGARPGREPVSGVVRREARRAAGGAGTSWTCCVVVETKWCRRCPRRADQARGEPVANGNLKKNVRRCGANPRRPMFTLRPLPCERAPPPRGQGFLARSPMPTIRLAGCAPQLPGPRPRMSM